MDTNCSVGENVMKFLWRHCSSQLSSAPPHPPTRCRRVLPPLPPIRPPPPLSRSPLPPLFFLFLFMLFFMQQQHNSSFCSPIYVINCLAQIVALIRFQVAVDQVLIKTLGWAGNNSFWKNCLDINVTSFVERSTGFLEPALHLYLKNPKLHFSA